MNTPSHLAFGTLCAGLLASAAANPVSFGLNGLTAQCAAVALLGALVPDLDSPKAPVSRLLSFVSSPVCRRFAHRTLLHSLVGMVLAIIPVYGLLRLGGIWAGLRPALVSQFFAVGYFSHLVLDTLTKRGVPYLWPLIRNPFGYPTFEEDRIISGDLRWELGFTGSFVIATILLLPSIRYGAGTTLANVVGQLPQLRGVYESAVGQEVVVRFDGYRAVDKAPVAGEALALGEEGDGFVVLWQGQVHRLGHDQGDIRLLSGSVRLLEQAPQVRTVSLAAASSADILAQTATGQPVLLSGKLTADRTFAVRRPFDEEVVRFAAKELVLVFAQTADIAGLAVRPEAAGGSAEALQTELEARLRTEDSLLAVMGRTRDMYQRSQLFGRIEVARGAQKDLAEKLGKAASADTTVRFSGELTVRQVPAF